MVQQGGGKQQWDKLHGAIDTRVEGGERATREKEGNQSLTGSPTVAEAYSNEGILKQRSLRKENKWQRDLGDR